MRDATLMLYIYEKSGDDGFGAVLRHKDEEVGEGSGPTMQVAVEDAVDDLFMHRRVQGLLRD